MPRNHPKRHSNFCTWMIKRSLNPGFYWVMTNSCFQGTVRWAEPPASHQTSCHVAESQHGAHIIHERTAGLMHPSGSAINTRGFSGSAAVYNPVSISFPFSSRLLGVIYAALCNSYILSTLQPSTPSLRPDPANSFAVLAPAEGLPHSLQERGAVIQGQGCQAKDIQGNIHTTLTRATNCLS